MATARAHASEQAEARRLRDALDASRREQQQLEQSHAAMAQALERDRRLREVLSAIKIAVLAPCLKLHVNGLEPTAIGSPNQVDFGQISALLEAEVLSRSSNVSVLADDTQLEQGSAHAIFPELNETMAHVQREVRERLVTMMSAAGTDEEAQARPPTAADRSM